MHLVWRSPSILHCCNSFIVYVVLCSYWEQMLAPEPSSMEYEQIPGRLFVESRCRDPDLDLLFQPFLGRSSDTQPTTTAQHARWLLDILTSSPQYSSRLTGNLHLHSAGFILGELNALMFKTDNSDFLMHFCLLLSRPLKSILLLSCLCPLHLSPKLFTLQVSSANAVSSLVRSWACWRFHGMLWGSLVRVPRYQVQTLSCSPAQRLWIPAGHLTDPYCPVIRV